MTVHRERLEDRRSHWLYRFQSGDQHFTGGIGRFSDGRIAEIFINGSKVGSEVESNAQDAAIIASLALQHGCSIDTVVNFQVGGGGTSRCLDNTGADGTLTSTGNNSISVTSNNTSGNAHPQIPPAIVCNYIIRII